MSDRCDRARYDAITDLPEKAREVLDFWFGDLTPDRWFATDGAVDAAIRERFLPLHRALAREVPANWLTTAHGTLAAVVVLDQFSRNLFRHDGRAFAQDEIALKIAKRAIDASQDAQLSHEEKSLLYMPLMHSETRSDVHRCTRLMEAAGATDSAEFSRRHEATIERFGRYPARNAALGRDSTPDERAFLDEHPHGF